MGWADFVVVGLCALALVLSPPLLLRAVRQRERHRVCEIPVAALVLGWVAWQVLDPAAVRQAPPAVHWAARVVAVLFLANVFGLSRWLFGRRGTPEVEIGASPD